MKKNKRSLPGGASVGALQEGNSRGRPRCPQVLVLREVLLAQLGAISQQREQGSPGSPTCSQDRCRLDAHEREPFLLSRAALAAPAVPFLRRPDLSSAGQTPPHRSGPDYFACLRKALRPGAEVAVVDFWPGSKLGPPDSHKISEQAVIAEMEAAGYRLARRPPVDLPHQYLLVFEPRS